MTEDQLYIENHRYLAAAFFVLPLPSGRIAVLTPRRDLFRIVEDWAEAQAVGPRAAAPAPNLHNEAPRHSDAPRIKLDLSKLGVS